MPRIWVPKGVAYNDDAASATPNVRRKKYTQLCRYFAAGKCIRDGECPFQHDVLLIMPSALGNQLAESNASSPNPLFLDQQRYMTELHLNAGPERCIPLDVLTDPAVTEEECRTMSLWRKKCIANCLPNGLIALGSITRAELDAFSGWSLMQREQMPRTSVLCTAIKHFREQVDARNRQQLWRPKVRKSLHALWKSKLLAAELAEVIEPQLGVTGFSFAEVLASDVLSGGLAEFKKGLHNLRSVQQSERIAALEACVARADESDLDKLVYLARRSVVGDWDGDETGTEGEASVSQLLHEAGVETHHVVTEEEQRKLQIEIFGYIRFPTPDLVFHEPVYLGADLGPFRWLDVKNTVVFPGYTMARRVEKQQAQLQKYVQLFGPGAVLWLQGYPHSLPKCEQASFIQLKACRRQGTEC